MGIWTEFTSTAPFETAVVRLVNWSIQRELPLLASVSAPLPIRRTGEIAGVL